MATDLHQQIIQKAGDKIAFSFSLQALENIFMHDFSNAYNQALGQVFDIQGSPRLAVKLIDINPVLTNFDIRIEDQTASNPVRLEIANKFYITMQLHLKADQKVKFSNITYEVTSFISPISVFQGELSIAEDVEFIVNSPIIDDADKQQNIIDNGFTEKEIMSVEGSIAYVLPKKIINSKFTSLAKLKLKQIFTPFSSIGDLDICVIEALIDPTLPDKDRFLVLISKIDISIDQLLGCGLTLGMDIPKISFLDLDNPWNIANKSVKLAQKSRDRNGLISTYIPRTIFEHRFGNVAPAITYDDSNNGFIGYDLFCSISLKYISLKIDIARMCLIVNIELYIHGNASLTIDAGECFGRVHLADATFDIRQCKFDFVLDFVQKDFSELYIKSNIENLDMGKTDINLSAVSKWASLAGGEAGIYGWLFDQVLARVLKHNIPIEIGHIIEKQGSISNIKLFDLSKLEKYFNRLYSSSTPKSKEEIDFSNYNNLPQFGITTFSGTNDSVLVGMTIGNSDGKKKSYS